MLNIFYQKYHSFYYHPKQAPLAQVTRTEAISSQAISKIDWLMEFAGSFLERSRTATWQTSAGHKWQNWIPNWKAIELSHQGLTYEAI